MASTSTSQSKPARGILKTSKLDQDQPDAKKKRRKLPPWMLKTTDENEAESSPHPLLEIPESIELIYTNNANDCSSMCNNFLEMITAIPVYHIGFDIEWPISYSKKESKAAVVQICDDLSKKCYVFHISCMGFIPPLLRTIIESEDIVKVGLNIEGDLYKLCRDFDVNFPKDGFLDLGDYANRVTRSSEKWSLAHLVRFLFARELPKLDTLRKSNWAVYPLSADQIKYAALDAIASLMVFQVLKKREKVYEGK